MSYKFILPLVKKNVIFIRKFSFK